MDEFDTSVGNDYYIPPKALRLKDDVRDPDVARRYADSFVPPLFAAETSFFSPSQLARMYDVGAALSFAAGSVMRGSFERKLDTMTKKVKALESDMEVVRGKLSNSLMEVEKEKKEKKCLEDGVRMLKSKLEIYDAQAKEAERALEEEKARGKALEMDIEKSAELRRDILLAFPRLFKLAISHSDVMGIIGEFNKATFALGRHSVAMELSDKDSSLDPTSLPFYDASSVGKMEAAHIAFEKKSFLIVNAIAEDPDASLEDIVSLLSPPAPSETIPSEAPPAPSET